MKTNDRHFLGQLGNGIALLSLGIVVAILTACASAVVGADLRLHLNFDDDRSEQIGDKSILHDRAGGLTAELHNTHWTEGRFDKALAFNGKPGKEGGSFVVLPETRKKGFFQDFDGGPFTIEMWFKPSSKIDYRLQQELVNTGGDNGPGYRLTFGWRMLCFRSGTGRHDTHGKADTWSISTVPARHKVRLDAWNHVAVVKDGAGIVTLYLNGQAAVKSEKPFRITRGTRPITLGAYMEGYAYPLLGGLDEVRIYKGAKTPSEVLAASQGLAAMVALKLDGRLDEPVWKTARRFGSFKLMKGAAPAPVQTDVRVAHDARNLYFGITAHEPNMARLKDVVRTDGDTVYRDDCVEIMLDADGNQADYYHFVVNASGYHRQAMRVQTGLVEDVWHNTHWFSAARKSADHWSVEVAIPWAVLNAEQDLVNALRFNVARDRRAGGRPLVESSVANGVFHTPGKFLDYAADGVDLTPFRLRRGLFSLSETRMVAGRLNATVAFDLKNPTGQAANVALQMALTSADGEVILTAATARVAPGATQTLAVPFALAKSGNYLLTLAAMSDGAVVLDAADAMPIRFVPLTIHVTRPFFRNNLYATEKLDQVEATVKIGLTRDEITESTLRVFLKEGTGTQRAETTVANPMLEQHIAFPTARLVSGENTLHALLTKGNKTIAETTVAVHKLDKAPGTEVRIDERLRMVVDGTPVLPIVWWGGATFEEIARTGSDGIIVGHTGNPRPQLDKLQAVGQKGCVVLMDGAMAKKILYGQTEFTDTMRAYVQGVVTAVKDHPAMLCYYLADEPEAHDVSADLLRAYYETLRQLDPYHPVLITNDSARGIITYADCHDMFVPDPYILPVKGAGLQRGMDYVVTFMQTMRAAGNEGQLLGFTPQVFNYGDYGQHNGRAPSFVEQRCQQYLGIVSGVRFFSYYKYGSMKGYPELQIGLPELMKEIRAVSPVLLHGTPDTTVTANKRAIHLAAWRYQGARYVIACNATPKAVQAAISLPGATAVRVISEDRFVALNDVNLRDHFQPYEVHAYTTDSAFRSPITLSDLQQRIEDAGGTFRVNY